MKCQPKTTTRNLGLRHAGLSRRKDFKGLLTTLSLSFIDWLINNNQYVEPESRGGQTLLNRYIDSILALMLETKDKGV